MEKKPKLKEEKYCLF